MNIDDITKQGEEQKKAVERTQKRHATGGMFYGMVIGFGMGAIHALGGYMPQQVPADQYEVRKCIVSNIDQEDVNQDGLLDVVITSNCGTRIIYGKSLADKSNALEPLRVELYDSHPNSVRTLKLATVTMNDGSRRALAEQEPGKYYVGESVDTLFNPKGKNR